MSRVRLFSTLWKLMRTFTHNPPWEGDLRQVLQRLTAKGPALLAERGSDARLRALPDPHLRCCVRGVPDDAPVQLGSLFHVALWEQMLAAARCCDQSLVQEIMNGVSMVCEISRSHHWPPERKQHSDHMLLPERDGSSDKVVRVVGSSSV